jgi:hypothetical protein
LSRDEALKLPGWEFDSLLEELERQNAKEQLDLLTIYCASFSGDREIIKSIEQQLSAIKNYNILLKESDSKTDEILDDSELSFRDIWGFDL